MECRSSQQLLDWINVLLRSIHACITYVQIKSLTRSNIHGLSNPLSPAFSVLSCKYPCHLPPSTQNNIVSNFKFSPRCHLHWILKLSNFHSCWILNTLIRTLQQTFSFTSFSVSVNWKMEYLLYQLCFKSSGWPVISNFAQLSSLFHLFTITCCFSSTVNVLYEKEIYFQKRKLLFQFQFLFFREEATTHNVWWTHNEW